MKSLKNTRTAVNLMNSFAGESQARTRYTYYSDIAKKEGLVQISNIFTETAENEKEHAKRFFKFLNNDCYGETIEITGSFPVVYSDTISNLKSAAEGEHEEYTDMYPTFAKVADEEGFPEISKVFLEIAKAESRHEVRFNKLVVNLENKKVFNRDEIVEWKCNNCGYIHTDYSAPIVCPACDHPQAHFEIFIETY